MIKLNKSYFGGARESEVCFSKCPSLALTLVPLGGKTVSSYSMQMLFNVWVEVQRVEFINSSIGNSLMVQRLGLRASIAGGMGSIPGQGAKISQAMQRGQK